jgi:hypothetical protein
MYLAASCHRRPIGRQASHSSGLILSAKRRMWKPAVVFPLREFSTLVSQRLTSLRFTRSHQRFGTLQRLVVLKNWET